MDKMVTIVTARNNARGAEQERYDVALNWAHDATMPELLEGKSSDDLIKSAVAAAEEQLRKLGI